jgi:hypothetical protein
MFPKFFGFTFLSALVGLGPAQALEGQTTTIKIAFLLATNVLEPTPTTGHHTGYSGTVTLSGGNRVTEHWKSEGVSGTNAAYHIDQSGLGGAWRVISPTSIRGTWRMVNYSKSVVIRISGKSCSVDYQAQLDPGEKIYRGKIGGVIYSYTRPTILDPTCVIQ